MLHFKGYSGIRALVFWGFTIHCFLYDHLFIQIDARCSLL